MRRLLKIGFVLTGIGLLAGCRQDMHDQPRFKPLARNTFFLDQRSERRELREDTYFFTGKIGSSPGDLMPFPVTKEVLERGEERFNIFCAPCHSRLGDGNGMIPSRGFNRRPPSYHIERLRKAPLGYLYDVISNGFGIMPDYAAQIPPADRWAIVAYVRALQLSQSASSGDVPSGQSVPSAAPKFRGVPEGAVLPDLASPKKESEGEPR
jgi:Cytochrome C oxidase, cbb3-type, subunit III